MIIFPGQFEAFRTRGDGCRILSISTYEDHAEEVSKVINGKLGQEYVVILIETGGEEHQDFAQETTDETKKRFSSQMHAIIGEIAEIEKKTPEEVKDKVRDKLIAEGKIKESTTELTLDELARVIIRLKKWKNDISK